MNPLTGLDIDSAFRLGMQRLTNELIKRGLSPTIMQSAMDSVLAELAKESIAPKVDEVVTQAELDSIRSHISCSDAAFDAFTSIFNMKSFTRTREGFMALTKINISIYALTKELGLRIAEEAHERASLVLLYSKLDRMPSNFQQCLTYLHSSIVYRECIDPTMPEYRNILIDISEDNEIRIKLVDISWD